MSLDRPLNFSISPAPSLHLHRCRRIKHTAPAPPSPPPPLHTTSGMFTGERVEGTTGALITAPATLTPPPLRAVIERHCGDAAVVFSNDFFLAGCFFTSRGLHDKLTAEMRSRVS